MEKKIIEFNGEIFIETTYMGIPVIIDSNDYYQVSSICKDYDKFKRWITLEHTKDLILAYKNKNISEENLELIKYRPKCFQNFQGTYIHKCLVHHLCEWCNPDYSIIISKNN